MKLSLIIPTHGRFRLLHRLLESVGSSLPPDTWDGVQILVVCDGCLIPASLASEYAGQVAFIAIPHSGAGAARNAGARASNGEWLYFTDDDCVLPRSWRSHVFRAVHDADDATVMLGGDVLSYEPRSSIAHYLTHVGHLRGPLLAGERIASIATANAVVRRSAFQHVRGFDERLKEGSEDANLTWRLGNLGAVRFDSRFFVYHDNNIGLTDFVSKFWRYGYSNAKNNSILGICPDFGSTYYMPSRSGTVGLVRTAPSWLRRAKSRVLDSDRQQECRHRVKLYLCFSLLQEVSFQVGYARFGCDVRKKRNESP